MMRGSGRDFSVSDLRFATSLHLGSYLGLPVCFNRGYFTCNLVLRALYLLAREMGLIWCVCDQNSMLASP